MSTLEIIIIIILVLAVAPFESNHKMVIADATTKTLATNYTLVNLGNATATVTAQYLTPAGAEWGNSIFKNFSIYVKLIIKGKNQIFALYLNDFQFFRKFL